MGVLNLKKKNTVEKHIFFNKTMSDFCFICHCPATFSDIQTHFCTESATISGKSILNIANDILALSDIDVTSITCQLCYEIVDEIDAFDHSLAQAKQKLQDRYEPKLRQDTNDKNLQNLTNALEIVGKS